MRLLLELLVISTLAHAQPAERGTPPVVAHRVEPEYSPEARAAGLEGNLTLYVEVETDGRPANVRVIQGLGMGLDENAMTAVLQWRFEPAMVSGAPTKIAQSVELPFRLNPGGVWRVLHTAYAVAREDSYSVEPIEKPVLIAYKHPQDEACGASGDLVVLQIEVNRQGEPSAIRIVHASSAAAGSAVSAAAEAWKFQSPLGGGQPRVASATLTLECGPETPSRSVSRVGGGVVAPKLTSKVEAEYSAAARIEKHQGTVTVILQIDSSGFASRMQVYRMVGQGLDANAMEAIRAWRFKPAMKDGKPVAVESRIEVSFRIM
jgi:TonB family protein